MISVDVRGRFVGTMTLSVPFGVQELRTNP